MAENYGFFDNAPGDVREYSATEYAELFNTFFNSGVANIGGAIGLKVLTGASLSINVEIGFAILKGYYYKNDTVINKTLDAADSTLDRIDRVILRLDYINRTIIAAVKKGTISSSPIPPALQRDSSIYELSLAQAFIKAKATTAVITDERLDPEVCGLVSVAAGVPDQEMWDRFSEDWNEIKAEWEAWYTNTYSQVGSRTFIGNDEPAGAALNDVWIDVWDEVL